MNEVHWRGLPPQISENVPDIDSLNNHIIDYVNDAIILTDQEFIIQEWNSAAERIYGWKKEEVLGKNIKDITRTKYLTIKEICKSMGGK